MALKELITNGNIQELSILGAEPIVIGTRANFLKVIEEAVKLGTQAGIEHEKGKRTAKIVELSLGDEWLKTADAMEYCGFSKTAFAEFVAYRRDNYRTIKTKRVGKFTCYQKSTLQKVK